MKEYHLISKLSILICLIGIILTITNWFTGFINTKIMTSGGSAICLFAFIMAMVAIVGLEKSRKH